MNIVCRELVVISLNPFNEKYLQIKENRDEHLLN
jgi:GTP cyclohydrolase II